MQLHWSTARYAPWQEGPLLQGLADLLQAGAVPQLGISNMGPKRLRRWHAALQRRGVAITSLQVQLSLLARQALIPGGVRDVCAELGIELIAYSPLALGLLSGRWQLGGPLPSGARGGLFRRLLPRMTPLLKLMAALAAERGVEPAAVALNWCRAHGAMPIPGIRRIEQVEAIRQSLRWSMSFEELQRLDDAAAMLQGGMPANPFNSS